MEVPKLPSTALLPQTFSQFLLLYSCDLFSVAGVQAAARRAGPGDWARAAGGRDPHGAPGADRVDWEHAGRAVLVVGNVSGRVDRERAGPARSLRRRLCSEMPPSVVAFSL